MKIIIAIILLLMMYKLQRTKTEDLISDFKKDLEKDNDKFKKVSFSNRTNILIEYFSSNYFNNKCDVFEPLNNLTKLIGNDIESNKIIEISYLTDVLFLDIKIKILQVEYKKEYQLNTLLQNDDELLNFAENSFLDFSDFTQKKTTI